MDGLEKLGYSGWIIASMRRATETDERIGQAHFNELLALRPDIANEIRGSDSDAFYVNEKLVDMCAAVYKLW